MEDESGRSDGEQDGGRRNDSRGKDSSEGDREIKDGDKGNYVERRELFGSRGEGEERDLMINVERREMRNKRQKADKAVTEEGSGDKNRGKRRKGEAGSIPGPMGDMGAFEVVNDSDDDGEKTVVAEQTMKVLKSLQL